MDWNVRFRFNKATGEVEVFEVDYASTDSEQIHNREHDALAAELGGLLEQAPRVVELFPGGGAAALDLLEDEEGGSAADEAEKPRER